MCGRYFFDLSSSELKNYYDQIVPTATNKHLRVGYNEIFPSNHVITLGLNQESNVVPGITRWGFESFKKGQLLINARAETVEEKKTFSKPFRETRCVFPMTGFYEWDSNKQKLLFTSSDNEVIFVGGFYRIHKTGTGFETESIILTTTPNDSVAPIHDRMPLIIVKEQVKEWITNLDFARNYLKFEMPELERAEVKK
ncbi:hypothetical protein A5844_001850 [Enterococcus sp. 10A9_DIV0425]|uniref:Abasic site processing protein n=2 Tax=Candidatus Enterococcus wittei TaxID=1987383 RepID=A0A242JY45_9ENTE|nr:SOS response-associated peptidase [Enterococcus sp. 10A9_DIV0425]OTP10152.1 hypothetical protein A5844_001850 [Enterococcus sp. 10A9_DIV0425]THE12387.1 SOS response-associated peptidase [Enterococcus hirae]